MSLISQQEFHQAITALENFTPSPTVAVAVSGGCDSLCLTLLLNDWVQQHNGKVIALTVDHQLRTESSAEALQVGTWLKQKNIEHHILPWTGTKPLNGIQAAARDARYKLMGDWCAQHQIAHLCVAHNANDQVETLLFRLCRGSGLDGLAGMSAVVNTPQVCILRPLLNFARDRIQATLQTYGQEWIEDPSNVDPTHTRPRLRRILSELESEGLTTQRLLQTAKKLGKSRAALEKITNGILDEAFAMYPEGYGFLNHAILKDAPEDVALRILSAALMTTGGKVYPPRSQYLERLLGTLQHNTDFHALTCWGCYIMPWQGQILFMRETSNIKDEIQSNKSLNALWDNRFTIVAEGAPGLVLKKLGGEGWKQLKTGALLESKLNLPDQFYPTLPALWKNDHVLAVPHLHFYEKPSILAVHECCFTPKRMLHAPTFRIA